MRPLHVNAIGLLAPGLPDWARGRSVLRRDMAYAPSEMPPFDANLLPRAERRRTTFTIRLALQVAQEAMTASGGSPAGVYSVFACSGGDTEILDKICTALTLPERPVSPGHFHNSVHNAPAGYWAIGSGSRAPSTSLSAYDSSFAAGLVDAMSLVAVEDRAVLLVAYDVPPPHALLPFRPLCAPFGTALLLSNEASGEGATRLSLEIARQQEEDQMADPGLEALRVGNPAARSLPLLRLLAQRGAGQVVLPYFPDSQLLIRVAPR